MSHQVLFNPKVFRSYETLQDYFFNNIEIKAIKAQTIARANIQTSLVKKICIIVMAPFILLDSLFFGILAINLTIVGATNLANRCMILSFHCIDNLFFLKKIPLFGRDLLVLAKNEHKLSASDLYLTKKIERKSISKDPRLLQLIYSDVMKENEDMLNLVKLAGDVSKGFLSYKLCEKWKNDKKFMEKYKKMRKEIEESIKTNEEHKKRLEKVIKEEQYINFLGKGYCAGMSVWFAYLYLNSNQLNQDSLKHIEAVARQFDRGAPSRAGLLQSLFPSNVRSSNLNLLKLQIEKTSCFDIAQSHNFFEFLDKKENGIYLMNFTGKGNGHAMCFIKEDGHKYIFDPNSGLIKVDNEKTFQALYNLSIKGQYDNLDIDKINKGETAAQPKNLFSVFSRFFSKKTA